MPQGLQVFNSGGAVICDITDRLTRMLGSQTISGNGSIVVSQFSQGAGFYFTIPLAEFEGALTQYPIVEISGTTLSWSTPDTPHISVVLYYGVY